LYDKVYRSDVLWEAWKRVKANGGVAGNDGETIKGITERGEVEYLKGLQNELKRDDTGPGAYGVSIYPSLMGNLGH
jgi:hypothetical protein